MFRGDAVVCSSRRCFFGGDAHIGGASQRAFSFRIISRSAVGRAGVVATELYNMTGVVASLKGVFDLRLENLASSTAHTADTAKLRTMLLGHFV